MRSVVASMPACFGANPRESRSCWAMNFLAGAFRVPACAAGAASSTAASASAGSIDRLSIPGTAAQHSHTKPYTRAGSRLQPTARDDCGLVRDRDVAGRKSSWSATSASCSGPS